MRTPGGDSLPFNIALRRMKAEHERRAMRELMTDESLRERMRSEGVSSDLATMICEQFRMVRGVSGGDGSEPDERSLREDVTERLAYRYASIFLEVKPGADKLWDFDEILARAVTITFRAADGYGRNVAEVEGAEGQMELIGPVALAFRRYLEYIGLYIALAAREPCKHCTGIPEAGHCDECDGLAWKASAAHLSKLKREPLSGEPS